MPAHVNYTRYKQLKVHRRSRHAFGQYTADVKPAWEIYYINTQRHGETERERPVFVLLFQTCKPPAKNTVFPHMLTK